MCNHVPSCRTRQEHIVQLRRDMANAPAYHEYADQLVKADYAFVIRHEEHLLTEEKIKKFPC